MEINGKVKIIIKILNENISYTHISFKYRNIIIFSNLFYREFRTLLTHNKINKSSVYILHFILKF